MESLGCYDGFFHFFSDWPILLGRCFPYLKLWHNGWQEDWPCQGRWLHHFLSPFRIGVGLNVLPLILRIFLRKSNEFLGSIIKDSQNTFQLACLLFSTTSLLYSLPHYAWIFQNPPENVTVHSFNTSAGVIYCPASEPYFSESPVEMLSHDQWNHICVETLIWFFLLDQLFLYWNLYRTKFKWR